MTAKELKNELNLERFDVKGMEMVLCVNGTEVPLYTVEIDTERNVGKLRAANDLDEADEQGHGN